MMPWPPSHLPLRNDRYVEVETRGHCVGQTVVDHLGIWGRDANVEICMGVDAAGMLDLYYRRMTTLDNT